jgi:hypothetical protein
MMTDSAVATRPAMMATSIVLRPPTRSWDSRSCWVCVVPSQCAAEGGCGTPFVLDTLAEGS